jgi:diguanylate cyclase (GGDEF)-like protein
MKIMTHSVEEFKEFHWMMDMLQNIDVGLVVLNKKNKIQLWNSFMENHSGVIANDARNKNIFYLFPEIDKVWFQHKVASVFKMKIRAFSIWEQRPYIFKFKNYRPITAITHLMYQNVSIFPMLSTAGKVDNICIIIYDVTDTATNRCALNNLNDQLKILSKTDYLTGLNNRGYWQESQEFEYKKYTRYQHTVSLVIFDIDHFKRVNDCYGHSAGDDVIQSCAQQLMTCAREQDICGRYGGEEFVVLLSETDTQGAYAFSERLRKMIQNTSIHYQQIEIKITISLGICQLNPLIKSAKQWLEEADKALYQSKKKGRNQSTQYRCSKRYDIK